MIRRLLTALRGAAYDEPGRDYCAECGWWARPNCGHTN